MSTPPWLTFIGIDPSLRATGLVTWRSGRWFTTTIVTGPSTPRPARHHAIAMRILAMASPGGYRRGEAATLAIMEARITPADVGAVQTAMDLAELRGVINHALHVQGVPVVEVHPSTLKVYATGTGRASKQDMLLAARGRLGEHLHVANDDEADAAWLTAMAVHRYVRPLCALPARNVAAMDRIKWPPLTPETGTTVLRIGAK